MFTVINALISTLFYIHHVVRPDVFIELLKYPEVFFIRDVRKHDNSSEVFNDSLLFEGFWMIRSSMFNHLCLFFFVTDYS